MIEMPACGKLLHMDNEIKIKMARLAEFLDRHRLDGVFLNHRASFAWITGGKDNHIAGNSPNGVAGIIANRGVRICFTNSIEGPRFAEEELAGTGIQVETYPWYDSKAGQKKLKELTADWKIAADPTDGGVFDRFGAGFLPLPDDFTQLRGRSRRKKSIAIAKAAAEPARPSRPRAAKSSAT